MGDHDVSIYGDGKDGKQRHSSQRKPEEGVHTTEDHSIGPTLGDKGGRSQRKIETAVQQVGEREVDDEYCCRIAHLQYK